MKIHSYLTEALNGEFNKKSRGKKVAAGAAIVGLGLGAYSCNAVDNARDWTTDQLRYRPELGERNYFLVYNIEGKDSRDIAGDPTTFATNFERDIAVQTVVDENGNRMPDKRERRIDFVFRGPLGSREQNILANLQKALNADIYPIVETETGPIGDGSKPVGRGRPYGSGSRNAATMYRDENSGHWLVEGAELDIVGFDEQPVDPTGVPSATIKPPIKKK